MAPYIPEEKLLEIKDAAAIAEVIGQYINLTPRGRYLVGLCPFHAESNPSFTVYPEKEIFHCYGCGTGGNVFIFLMRYLRLSFPEAVAELARRHGIPLYDRDIGSEAIKQTRQRQAYYDLNAVAAAFFQGNLAHPQLGLPAREYLARRQLDPTLVQPYALGFAPDDWRGLEKHLSQKGASLAAAQELGLIIPRQTGGAYDRFRGRLIFPIHDREGRIVAFGGRIIGEGEPKYLNSPESPIYTKGRHLYGLHQAREAMRRQDQALLVEGYTDLLALRARGIEPVAATLGTALTRDQVRLLKGCCSRVILIFDGDAAGLKAMMRSFPHFAQERLAARVLTLPLGEDPDSYAQKSGIEVFRSPWDAAQPLLEFILESIFAGLGNAVEDKVTALEQLKPYLAAITDPVERSLWLEPVARRLGVSPQVLEAGLSKTAIPSQPSGRLPQERVVNLEQRLIKLILSQPVVLERLPLQEWLEDFEDFTLKEIARQIILCCQRHGHLDHGLLINQMDDEAARNTICALSLAVEEFPGDSLDLLVGDFHRRLHQRRLKKERQSLKKKLHTSASKEDLLTYTHQLHDLEQRLRELEMQP